MQKTTLKIGEILLYSGKIDSQQLKIALQEQEISGKKIGEILEEKGWVTSDDIVEVLEYQLGFPRVDLSKYEVNEKVVNILPEQIVRKYILIPIDKHEDKLVIAMADPLNFYAVDDVKLYTKMDLETVIATQSDIEALIDKYYTAGVSKRVLQEFDSVNNQYDDDYVEKEQAEVASAPIVRLINTLFEQALKMRASDIHLEPGIEDIRVRFRIDGDLTEIMRIPRFNLSAIVTRIKILGKMNIAEKRIPQDGRVESVINGKSIDMRISSLPTVYGEKIVIRLLDKESFNFSKEKLGFTEYELTKFDKILSQPYGMILVTGPTGSGKTTTLYTVLKELNTVEKNIITVEDPVEYKLEGINQVQVNVKAGLTFASGLRSILRQDPDIIMVGEIRDSETAEIAVRAAITGHLVLSTLHTNDSPSTIARLIDMGVEPYMVSSSVIGVVSQRLVKLLCPKCKESYIASETQKRMLGVEDESLVLHKPVGCNSCNKGYKGRAAVHEIMPINEEMRRLIDLNSNTDKLREQAIKDGMTTLLQSAVSLAKNGQTSYEEVMRVGFTLG
ncbi:MAG: Flp pilus assembly complex ATPase component TadA [Tissierellales bacterium]|nr:Flp pilus assembly complex ATPase component TadA [Tissierellales bacterium]